MSRVQYLLAGAAVAGLMLAATRLSAEPNSTDPHDLLTVRPDKLSADLRAEAKKLLDDAAEEVALYEENLENNRYKKANIRPMGDMGKTSLKLQQLNRMADRLVLLAEPMGVDLKFRVQALESRMGAAINKYRSVEGYGQLVPATSQALYTRSKNHERSIDRINELLNSDKERELERAETEFNEIYDDMHPLAAWQDRIVNERAFKPFATMRNAIHAKINVLREAQTQELLTQLRAKAAPPFDPVIAAIDKAVEEAKADGTAAWAGKQLDGPQLVETWGDGWRKMQLRALRCQAVDWLRGQNTGQNPPSDLDKLIASQQTFNQKMTGSIAALISADAARVQPDAAADLHARYVDSIARLTLSMGDDALAQAAGPALDQLAGKSPDLANAVASYHEATDELLRWRRRTAAAYARSRMAAAKPLQQVFQQAAASEPMQRRLFQAPSPDEAQLWDAAPAIVEHVAAATDGVEVWVSDVAPVGETGAQSRYSGRQYAQMPSSPAPTDAIDQLRHDLLVSPTAPPLSLAAARAIAGAETGHAVAAGGLVKGAHLDSLLTHNLTISDDAACIPVGPLPEEKANSQRLGQALMWFDLEPKWIQHEYLFVDLK